MLYLAVVLSLFVDVHYGDLLQKSIVTGLFFAVFWNFVNAIGIVKARFGQHLVAGVSVVLLVLAMSVFQPNIAVFAFMGGYSLALAAGGFLATTDRFTSKSNNDPK